MSPRPPRPEPLTPDELDEAGALLNCYCAACVDRRRLYESLRAHAEREQFAPRVQIQTVRPSDEACWFAPPSALERWAMTPRDPA